MAEKKDKKSEKDLKKEIEEAAKLFDVAKPGNTPASSTSRPTIVGHSPMIKKDPMVSGASDEKSSDDKADDKTGKEESTDEAPAKMHHEATIMPLGDIKKETAPEEDKTEKPTEEEVKDNPIEDKIEVKKVEATKDDSIDKPEIPADDKDTKPVEKEDEPNVSVEPEEAEPEEKTETAEKSEPSNAAVNTLVNEVSAKRESQKQKEEYDNKVKELEKLVQSKEYYVPIGAAARRRSTFKVLLSLIFLLALAAATLNFAIDAELLDLGLKPFTNIL